ncbi:MAG: hypothetical protein IKO90_00900 [Bacteroidales bacterium]|nr:hypothetical protein [Bacteroidales bacterium]MBR7035290.1 hypothetical protein [Bacteroidales bacterium]
MNVEKILSKISKLSLEEQYQRLQDAIDEFDADIEKKIDQKFSRERQFQLTAKQKRVLVQGLMTHENIISKKMEDDRNRLLNALYSISKELENVKTSS